MSINRLDITRGGAGAPPALRALVEGRVTVADLRAMRPLPENAQKLIDDAVIRVGLDRLAIVGDIISEGLTFNVGDDFWGITQLQWDEISETGGARRTMEPLARGENGIPQRRPRTVPLFLTWDNFELGIRTMRASQRGNAPLDVSIIEQKTRRVNEAIEDVMINGLDETAFGFSAPGLLNAPNASTYAYAGGEAWNAAGKTGQEILDDVLAMIDLARADRMFGPYNLYVPTNYGNALNKNFSDGVTTFDKSVRARLEEIVAGGRNLRVREADMLPANRTVLLQMTSNVVDVVIGQQPTVISWEGPSGLDMFWLILACVVPRLKTTYTDQSGVVVGNTV